MASFPKVTVFRSKVQAEGDGGINVGRTSKLRVTHAASELFMWNEKASNHLTDEALAEMLANEFPKREAAGKAAAKRGEGNTERPKTLQSISAYRGYYNAGKHGFGDGTNAIDEKPRLHSHSYNAEGVARLAGAASVGGKGKGKKAAKKVAKPTSKGKASKGSKPKAKKAAAAEQAA